MPVQAPPNPNLQTFDPDQQAPNPNQQTPPDPTLETIRIGLAGLDDNVDTFARAAAHEEMAEKKGPLWRRFTTSVWNTMMREQVLVKKTGQKREEILESGDLNYHKGGGGKDWYEGVSRRYTSEYAEHLMREGETFHDLNSPENEHKEDTVRIRTDINEFLSEYAKGNVDDASSEAYLDRMFEAWRDKGIGKSFIGEGQFLAHNMLDGARQVKAAYEARQGLSAIEQDEYLKEILEKVELTAGKAKVGSSVEIDETRSERLAKKMRGVPFINEGRLSKVGAVLGNEAVVAAALSVAFFVAQKGATTAASVLAPGLGAGIVAGFRERRALRDERRLMHRRADNGEVADTKNKAQAELDPTLYESRPVGELLDEIAALYDQNGDLIIHSRGDLDAAIRLQGELAARIQISDRDGAPLINFADVSPAEMESRRFDLMLAMAKLETDLKKQLPPGEDYAHLLIEQRNIMVGLLKGEMNEKDRLFNKLTRKRVLKRAVLTAVTAVGGGLLKHAVEHGAAALIGTLFDEDVSDVDMVMTGNETTIGGNAPDIPDTIGNHPIGGEAPDIPDVIGGKAPDIPDVIGERPSGDYDGGSIGGNAPDIPGQIGGNAPEIPGTIGGKAPEIPGQIGGEGFKVGDTIVLGNKTKVVLPEGYHLETNGRQVKLTMPNGSAIETMLEKNGTLGKNGLDDLEKKGFKVLHRVDPVQGEPKVTHEKVGATEFLANHKNKMVKITHEKWFTQNTRKYDLNELEQTNQKLANGNNRVSIQGMTANGSFVGKSNVNWHNAAKQGQLMLYMSASPGTQSHAFEIPIGPDGTVDIDKDSPAGALFNKEGKFIGGFQEVAVKGGTNKNGAIKIATLSTVVGTKHPEINDVIVTPTNTNAHTYTIVPPAEAMANSANYSKDESFFTAFIPIVVRRNLGETEAGPASTAPNNTNGVGLSGPSTQNQQVGPNIQNQQATPPGGAGPSRPNGGPTNPNNGPTTGPNSGPNNNGNTQKTKSNNAGGNQRQNQAPGGANPNNFGGSGGDPNKQKQNNSQANGGKSTPSSGGAQTPNGGSQANPNNAGSPNSGGQTNPNGGPQQPNSPNGDPQQPNNNGRPNGNGWQGSARQQTGRTNTNGNPNYKYANTYTDEEQDVLKRLNQDSRSMPDTFKTLRWNPNMSPIARKVISVVLHGLIAASNRQPGEPEGEWRVRVVQAGRVYAQQALGALGQALPGVRPFMQEAFEEFLRVTEPQPASNNSGQSSANTGGQGSSTSSSGTATAGTGAP